MLKVKLVDELDELDAAADVVVVGPKLNMDESESNKVSLEDARLFVVVS